MSSYSTVLFVAGLAFCIACINAASAADVARNVTSTVSPSRKTPVFRLFKLVKIGFIVKRVTPAPSRQQPSTTDSTPSESALDNQLIFVRPRAPAWIFVSPSKKTSTTTTASTALPSSTKAKPKMKPKVRSTLASRCKFICQRDKYTGNYAYSCPAFRRVGKYYLCWKCRFQLRVCDKMGIIGLING